MIFICGMLIRCLIRSDGGIVITQCVCVGGDTEALDIHIYMMMKLDTAGLICVKYAP